MSEELPDLEPKTLDLLFELSRHAPEAQLRDVESLDGKMIQVFSVASVLIGLAALRGTRHQTAAGVLLLLGIAAFLFVAYEALRVLWTRRFRVPITPPQLWQDYWADSVQSIKHALVADIADGYVENDGLLKEKRRSLTHALIAAGVEAVAIGVALAVSTF